MNIIIAGAGQVGTHLAGMLSQEEHKIIFMDSYQDRLKHADTHLDVMTITGSCSSVLDLKKANAHKADLFIAVTESEETNLTAAIFSKNIGAKKVVARVDNSEHLIPRQKEYLQSLGIDELVYPEHLAANEVVSSLKLTGAQHIHNFSGGKLVLFCLKINERSKILDKTLHDLKELTEDDNYQTVAIKRRGNIIIPRSHHRFYEGDQVYIISKPHSIKEVVELCGWEQFKVKNILIMGGSRIGMKTALALENNLNIKLFEKDKEKCIQLSDQLSDTLIVNGDGRDMVLLKEEGIENMDAFVAVTGNSETNILSCLLAQKMGVRHTIAEIENMYFIDLAERIDVGTIINKKLAAASYIYKFTTRSDIKDFVKLAGTEAEVVQLVANPKSKITRDKVKDLNFPEEAKIGGFIRNEASYIVDGESKIEAGDKVVVFINPSVIRKVEKFFK